MEYLNQIAIAPSGNTIHQTLIDVYRSTKAVYCNFYSNTLGVTPNNYERRLYTPDLRYGDN